MSDRQIAIRGTHIIGVVDNDEDENDNNPVEIITVNGPGFVTAWNKSFVISGKKQLKVGLGWGQEKKEQSKQLALAILLWAGYSEVESLKYYNMFCEEIIMKIHGNGFLTTKENVDHVIKIFKQMEKDIYKQLMRQQ